MQKITVAICDDEPVQRELLSSYLKEWSLILKKEIDIIAFNSAESFYFSWCEKKLYDILLLDVELEGKNGIELAYDIRKTDENLSIIFVTGYSEFIQEGYEVDALNYLIKPINKHKLFNCLDKALLKLKKEINFILLETDSGIIRLPQEHIYFVEAFAHNCTIHAANKGNHNIKLNIGALEKMLSSENFVRCHRSYIVNLKYVKQIDKSELYLDSGDIVPISRRAYLKINQAFINYYRGEVK